MGDNHGFQTVTGTDHRAWLWVVSLLSLTYSLLCLGARLTCKWEHLGYDDVVLGVGYVAAIAHYGTILNAISTGLGAFATIESSSRMAIVAEYYFASRILLFVTLWLSKVSVLIFTRSIFAAGLGNEKRYSVAAYASVTAFGVASVLLSSAGCHPQQALVNRPSAVCNANIVRWAVLTALDVVTELIIIALPAWAIAKVQIKTSKKRLVVFVFSFRLVVAALSIVVMVNYFAFLRGSRSEIDLVHTVVWQEILVGFSLMSASIPCIRAFLWAFMSMGLQTSYGSHHTTSGSRGGSQQLRSQHSRVEGLTGSQTVSDDPMIRAQSGRLRPDWLDYKVNVRASQRKEDRTSVQRRDAENISMDSNSSEQMIIHRNTEVEVHYS